MASMKRSFGRHWRKELGVPRPQDTGRSAFKGIVSAPVRRKFTQTAALDGPEYRHPKARLWARIARHLEAETELADLCRLVARARGIHVPTF